MRSISRPYFGRYVPGLHGCYPARMTTRQIHRFLANTVTKSSRRWPEYVAIEKAHGVDRLPDEARAWAYRYIRAYQMNFEDAYYVHRGWRDQTHRTTSLAPYERVLSFYLPRKRLRPLLFALRELAEEIVLKASPPLSALFKVREPFSCPLSLCSIRTVGRSV